MSRAVELLCSRRVPHVAVLALMSIGFAGCSADMQTRLSENPFASNEITGLCAEPAAVERHELPQYPRPQSAVSVAKPAAGDCGAAFLSVGQLRRIRRRPRALLLRAAVSSDRDDRQRVRVRSRRCMARRRATKIIVGTSDTLEILARRYNVTPAAILQANGYRGPRVLSPGQQLIIPRAGAVVRGSRDVGARQQAGRCRDACGVVAFMSSIPAIR